MRFVLALCVVVGCTLCGNAMADSKRRRVRLLESLAQGVKLLKLHMISMFQPVQQALRSSENDILEMVGAQMSPGICAMEAWARIRQSEGRRGGRIDALAPEDIRTLDELFGLLGETGRDKQEILLEGAYDALRRNIDAARRHTAETDRLYLSLGALTGLMIALILI